MGWKLLLEITFLLSRHPHALLRKNKRPLLHATQLLTNALEYDWKKILRIRVDEDTDLEKIIKFNKLLFDGNWIMETAVRHASKLIKIIKTANREHVAKKNSARNAKSTTNTVMVLCVRGH